MLSVHNSYIERESTFLSIGMKRARLVLGLFWLGLAMGGLLAVAGNVWVEFYLKYLNIESWMFDLSFSLVTLGLIGACVFLTAVQLLRGAEGLDIKRAIGVGRDYKIRIPERLAHQLKIGPGDQVAFTLDEKRLVLEKRE